MLHFQPKPRTLNNRRWHAYCLRDEIASQTVKIDGVLHNWIPSFGEGRTKYLNGGTSIFTCPVGQPFRPMAQHDIPETDGKFRTNGHLYDFD